METQTTINFDVHHFEDTLPSQLHLDQHRTHFSKQCAALFSALMSGAELTSVDMFRDYSIVDGRRRLLDLQELGIQISVRDILVNRCKVHYMTEQNKIDNQKFL